VDEQIELTVSDHRSRLADRLNAIDAEFAAKGLFRSGPRIRSAANAMKDHYSTMGKRLLAQAEVQPNPEEADRKIMVTLHDEFERLRDRLTEIVKSTDGGEAALNAAQQLLEPAREEIERLASISRVAWSRKGKDSAGSNMFEVPPGWPSDIPPEDYLLSNDQIALSDEVEAEVMRPAASWTGVPSRAARLIAVRDQLDVAHAAVGYLIDELADATGNGGPINDEDSCALDALRELHRKLGELLNAIDRGVLTDELGEGLAAEIARYAANAVETLRSEPARFVVGATICAVLGACGLGNLGGFLSGAAMSIRKRVKET
jgi:hypothetical protein